MYMFLKCVESHNREELYAAGSEMLLSEEHFTALCSVLASYLFIPIAAKALNAQTVHGLEVHTQEQISAQRGRILMLVAT